MIFAGIDAGGTSWKMLVGRGPREILARTVIPTTDPDTTLTAVSDWLSAQRRNGLNIAAIGLASFGPIDRDPQSSRYGEILDTPKPGWRGANPLVEIERRLGVPCALDTDVNGALLAEMAWGAAKDLRAAAYITVGTGVGGSAIIGGQLVGAPFHGEFGHYRPARVSEDIARFEGACPYHGDCVEGLISAVAVKARWNVEPHNLEEDHEAWPLIADALAQLCAAITYLLAPQRIILGGGLLSRESLIGRVRVNFQTATNQYGLRPEATNTEAYLVLPALRGDAGALGGVLLAANALTAKNSTR